MPNLSRRARVATVLAVLSAAGCDRGDTVGSYRAPKSTEPTGRAGPPVAADGKEYRILGAMYPADAPVWFFKLTGPADQLAKHEADFDKLAASVKLQGEAVPGFALPDGWKLAGRRSVTRMGVTVTFDETVKLGPPDAPLEVTVGRSGGSVTQNVGRWADQVGQAFAPADLATVTRPIDAAGGKGLRVDVRGTKNPAGGGMGPMMGGKR